MTIFSTLVALLCVVAVFFGVFGLSAVIISSLLGGFDAFDVWGPDYGDDD